MSRQNKYAELETALGCKFRDQDLLVRALTHGSVRQSANKRIDNERLEFLGDRVLGLVVAEHLHKSLPDVREGDLARRFNALVCGDTCAEVGKEIDLGRFLILSSSEADNGGREKETILADAVEAILGAVFLDRDFDAAKRVVHAIWGERLDEITTTKVDPKSALQEWAQSQSLRLPRYTEISRTGPDHNPCFVAEVSVEGIEPQQGEGSSKRSAQQEAARALLVREGVWREKNKA
ncbi:MAG: ribonuclease III [Hyphomicrobiaceae bacterium TMED74]|nr:ribonuclease III [Filomicrobium sp.]RPG41088.1 MAG: ribonuclease III [Hyphomicrobiaceae bacterium TMED74]